MDAGPNGQGQVGGQVGKYGRDVSGQSQRCGPVSWGGMNIGQWGWNVHPVRGGGGWFCANDDHCIWQGAHTGACPRWKSDETQQKPDKTNHGA